MTQVVRVDESVPPIISPAPESPPAKSLEQFNAEVPADLLRRTRRYKADTRKTLNQITTETLAMYLDAMETPASMS